MSLILYVQGEVLKRQDFNVWLGYSWNIARRCIVALLIQGPQGCFGSGGGGGGGGGGEVEGG